MPTVTLDGSDPVVVSPVGARVLDDVRDADRLGGLPMSMAHPATRLRLVSQGLVTFADADRLVLTALGWRVVYALADSTTKGA